ncbi:MAG: hypothetical protein FJ000_05020, partial [Actinobacteria bacterium]|nr:hypothetical protein [Actinomycetota bacterium]
MTQTREETAAKRRAYYLAHREEALAKRKAYYEKNREAILAAGREERTNKRKADTSGRTCWKDVLAQARTIVESYEDTGVTLRQLFYRLVAAELVPNTKNAYQTLSKRSAEARRDGTFPDLIDHTRQIHRYLSYRSPEAALADLRSFYRRDRTEGQMQTVYIGVEKNGMVEQLQSWFGDLGLPILALGGYASQAYVKQVYQDACREGREAVLLYAGDFDPSGEDIPRDFAERAGCFDEVHRVAL